MNACFRRSGGARGSFVTFLFVASLTLVMATIDRDGPDVVRKFFGEIGVRNLALYIDPSMEAQSKLELIGVPTTLLIEREGREVARYTGVAEWDRPEVIDAIERYTGKRN